MKKLLALLAGISVACSVNATPIISSTLGIESEAGVSPVMVAPELGSAVESQALYGAAASVVVRPSIVIPEPTTLALLLAAMGVCGVRKLRHRQAR
jgi:hypothetical protein